MMIARIKKKLRSGKNIYKRYHQDLLIKTLGTITRVETDKKVAALTFDDGPDSEYTPRFLDILNKFNAKATFFVLGKQVDKNPGIIERAIKEGHTIGNHTWDHPAIPLLSRQERFQQMKRCRNVLPQQEVNLFRPPYGYIDYSSRLDAVLLGYRIIGWNTKAFDWLDHDADKLLSYLNSSLSPGCILLMHDALWHQINARYRTREPLLESFEIFLEMHHNDYKFVTIPELLEYGKPIKKYFNPDVDIAWLNSLMGESVYRYGVNGKRISTINETTH
jgi:peptidoglycan-N-acetylglucosamine deacetylase